MIDPGARKARPYVGVGVLAAGRGRFDFAQGPELVEGLDRALVFPDAF
jgi:hypothetical protein